MPFDLSQSFKPDNHSFFMAGDRSMYLFRRFGTSLRSSSHLSKCQWTSDISNQHRSNSKLTSMSNRAAPFSLPHRTSHLPRPEATLRRKPPLLKSPPSSNNASVVSLRRQVSLRLVASCPSGTHKTPVYRRRRMETGHQLIR